MAVDRLSVTVPAHVGEALRAYAEREGLAVSAVVARAIEREIRHVALGAALDEFERAHGAFTKKQLAESAALFDRAAQLEKGASAAEADRPRVKVPSKTARQAAKPRRVA